MSLVEISKEAFQQSKHEPSKQSSRISPGFTAWKLVHLCQVKIDWTDSLSDHLRFDHGSKILMVYRQKVCLLGHWSSSALQIKHQDDSSKKNDNTSGAESTNSIDWIAAGNTEEIPEGSLDEGGSAGQRKMQIRTKRHRSVLDLGKKGESTAFEMVGR